MHARTILKSVPYGAAAVSPLSVLAGRGWFNNDIF